MSQKNKIIALKDLILWTENPRDPVEPDQSDQDIANRTISKDGRSRWSLKKLFDSMGSDFDQSEIPTVVYMENKPIVYDGNRRVLIGKIKHGYIQVNEYFDFSNIDFPPEIPCNVCDMKTALSHVYRKHADSGSWKPLERDIFKHKHMDEKKSKFYVLDEATGLISASPRLNQRFVKEEIFTSEILDKLGFSVSNGKLMTKHSQGKQGYEVLCKIKDLVEKKMITTREQRGQIINLLEEDEKIKQILENKSDKSQPFIARQEDRKLQDRKTKITKKKPTKLFGETLILKPGIVNNIYSDISLINKLKNKHNFSEHSPMIIRMGLRLLCETAALKDNDKNGLKKYIETHFETVKKLMNADDKTTLRTQAIYTAQDVIKLLHIGAHRWSAGTNEEQTLALSLIIGKILKISHGK